jgi:hypothetical protein
MGPDFFRYSFNLGGTDITIKYLYKIHLNQEQVYMEWCYLFFLIPGSCFSFFYQYMLVLEVWEIFYINAVYNNLFSGTFC